MPNAVMFFITAVNITKKKTNEKADKRGGQENVKVHKPFMM
jgi:hypothetical protein